MLSTCPLRLSCTPRGSFGFVSATSWFSLSATDARSAPSTLACTSNVRAMLKCVMLAGLYVRVTCARFDKNWGLEPGVEIGVDFSASRLSTPYCGVCTATRYWMPRFGSTQKLGETWPLEDSDTSRSLATS